MSTLYTSSSISYSAALTMVQAAVNAALEDKVAVCVAVVDRRGELKAFAAMDGSPAIAQGMCQRKAYTALMGLSSEGLGEAIAAQPAMLASFAAQDRIAMMGGGLPIVVKGEVVGAIGVGGAMTEQDIAYANRALETLDEQA